MLKGRIFPLQEILTRPVEYISTDYPRLELPSISGRLQSLDTGTGETQHSCLVAKTESLWAAGGGGRLHRPLPAPVGFGLLPGARGAPF